MKTIPACLLLLSLTGIVYADIAGDMDTFLNGIGYASNTTNPAAFQSQAAGFFGGGSLYLRNQVREYQLVQLD